MALFPAFRNCRCNCVDPEFFSVDRSGVLYSPAYRFAPICRGTKLGFYAYMHNVRTTNKWRGELGVYPEDGNSTLIIDCGGQPKLITFEMTMTSTDAGGIEIVGKDQDGADIVKFVSLVAIQANCDTALKRTWFKAGCEFDWDPWPCLRPLVFRPLLCAEDGTLCCFDYTITVNSVDTGTDNHAVIEAMDGLTGTIWEGLFGIHTQVKQVPGVVGPFGTDFWMYEARAQSLEFGIGGGSGRTHTVIVSIYNVAPSGHAGLGQQPPSLDVGSMVYANAISVDGGTFIPTDLPYTGPVTCWDGDASNTESRSLDPFLVGHMGMDIIDVNLTLAVTVHDLSTVETRVACEALNDDCGGTTLWRLKRRQTGPNAYLFYWEIVESDCGGPCRNDFYVNRSCVAQVPDNLPEYSLTEAEATEAGYWANTDTEFVGGCGCGEVYVPPDGCTLGTSTWKIQHTLCTETGIPGLLYLYYWVMLDSTCDGVCASDSCRPVPPFPLITTPMNDDDATELGYIALLGVELAGSCNCTEAYVPPECPVCEGCPTFDKHFDVVITDPSDPFYESFAGHYVLGSTGICAWSGFNEGAIQEGDLSWAAGHWTLSLGAGAAIYEADESECKSPLVLTKTSGDVGFPSTITIT